MLINELILDDWARNNPSAPTVLVELVWRLVAASTPYARHRRFPLVINQPGPDGFLESDQSHLPFVPDGKSYWEIGSNVNPKQKAKSDYDNLTGELKQQSPKECGESTFVFITPISGQRSKWLSSAKQDGRAAWVREKLTEGAWKDVRVIDGADLVAWLHDFPAVEAWFAGKILGVAAMDLESVEVWWDLTRISGEPHPLQPSLFLVGREQASQRLASVLTGISGLLALDTHYPEQVADFVAAYIASLDPEIRVATTGRCLLVRTEQAWRLAAALPYRHTLIAAPSLDLLGPGGTELTKLAERNGHGIVFGTPRGGTFEAHRCALPSPSVDQVRQELVNLGLSAERSRRLARMCDGNLSALLRCMQTFSASPSWAQAGEATDLAICALIGQWDESNPADREAVEQLSGKAYGEWIAAIREAAARPGIPLRHRERIWRFTSRYEGWHALGNRLFEEHLERFGRLAVEILEQDDPALSVPLEERFIAPIRGLRPRHSSLLRQGIADGLALLGSYPKALTSCSHGVAAGTAAATVRAILAPGTWQRWATLDRLLPSIAEAEPSAFLDALESTTPEEIEALFRQEGDGLTAGNYASGLLWALEALAWSPDLLGRVTLCLGDLAAADPGGNWTNRPANSLRTIFLPWFPQTMASTAQQQAAFTALCRDQPTVAWQLSLALLPEQHAVSMGGAKPSWRPFIAEDWSDGVTRGQRWNQEDFIAARAIELAGRDPTRLVALIERIGMLGPAAFDSLVSRLSSPEILAQSEEARSHLWEELEGVLVTHRKFPEADWAMPADRIREIEAVADRLAPSSLMLRHRRLFTERSFGLFEDSDDYNTQRSLLEKRRSVAVQEIAEVGGAEAVVQFAASVESPWLVGLSYGEMASTDADSLILPHLLVAESGAVTSFVAGYVQARHGLAGWDWVDGLPKIGSWSSVQQAKLLCMLPFDEPTWERAGTLLGAAHGEYWIRTSAQPYHTHGDLALGVDALLAHGRPKAAIHCLHWMSRVTKVTDPPRSIQALTAAVESDEAARFDGHDLGELISALQQDPTTDPEGLFRVEWLYLWALTGLHGEVRPRTLELRLASDPAFFCEVIRLAFRSEHLPEDSESVDENSSGLVLNAYNLLTHWTRVPGAGADSSLDAVTLQTWLETVKKECTASGHLAIAMQTVGRVLYYSPKDPGGLWIHRAAAEVLNDRGGDEVRTGFRIQVYNARGTHWVDPSGAAERALANNFREKAAALEAVGYHRLGATVRQIAEDYDQEAEQVVRRHGRDD